MTIETNKPLPSTLPVKPGIYQDGTTRLFYNVPAPIEGKTTPKPFYIFRFIPPGAKHSTEKVWKARLGLREVRKLYGEWEARLERSEDPREARNVARTETLSTFAERIRKDLIVGMNDREEGKWKRLIVDVPNLAGKPIGTITLAQVQAELAPIYAAKPDKAGRMRVRLHQLFAAAKGEGLYKGENPAAWENMKAKLGRAFAQRKKLVKRRAAIKAENIPALLTALAADTSIVSYCAQFVIFTALRSQEARLLEWSHIDLDAATCTVPRSLMKDKAKVDANDDPLPHVIPLAPQVVDMLRAVPRTSRYVFPTSQPGRAGTDTICADAILDRIQQYAPEGSVHGIRATFSTWINDTHGGDIQMFLLGELALDHAIHGAIAGRYIRLTPAKEGEKRRALMTAWADFARPRSNVVPFPKAA